MLLSKEEIISDAIPFTRLKDVEKASVVYFLIGNNESLKLVALNDLAATRRRGF